MTEREERQSHTYPYMQMVDGGSWMKVAMQSRIVVLVVGVWLGSVPRNGSVQPQAPTTAPARDVVEPTWTTSTHAFDVCFVALCIFILGNSRLVLIVPRTSGCRPDATLHDGLGDPPITTSPMGQSSLVVYAEVSQTFKLSSLVSGLSPWGLLS